MHYIKVRNFEEFQHYKQRNPPWIRLYERILRDRKFYRLDEHSKYVIIGLFLLASQHENKIEFDPSWISDQLNLQSEPNWQVILASEFIIPIDCDASTLLATCKHDASHIITDSSDNSDNSEAEILSFSKNAKRSVGEAIGILKFWNQQSATMHHRSLNGQEKAIVKTLRKYSPEEVCRAIERYSQVRANEAGKYRSLYAWTLGEFLTRHNHFNLERFNAEKWEEPFLEHSGNGFSKPSAPKLPEIEDDFDPTKPMGLVRE